VFAVARQFPAPWCANVVLVCFAVARAPEMVPCQLGSLPVRLRVQRYISRENQRATIWLESATRLLKTSFPPSLRGAKRRSNQKAVAHRAKTAAFFRNRRAGLRRCARKTGTFAFFSSLLILLSQLQPDKSRRLLRNRTLCHRNLPRIGDARCVPVRKRRQRQTAAR
jgi:hypothetical protein